MVEPSSQPPSAPGEITRLLGALNNGDESAMDHMLPLVYQLLREQAGRHLRRERAGHTLQPTALVHEAWLRLSDQHGARWQDRSHFAAVASMAMRRILADHARARCRLKRGGGQARVSLEDVGDRVQAPASERATGDVDLVALDEALDRLGRFEPRLARTVELRYFGGLSVEESAAALGVGSATVKRDWALARAWLRRELEDAEGVE